MITFPNPDTQPVLLDRSRYKHRHVLALAIMHNLHVPGWCCSVDPMTDAVMFEHDATDVIVWATPWWEGEVEIPVSVTLTDAHGDEYEVAYRLPFTDGCPLVDAMSRFQAIITPVLAMIAAAVTQ